jgi:hypothetical protein
MKDLNSKNTFEIIFYNDWFYTGDILEIEKGVKVRVIKDPYKKWWKLLLQWITFGFYRAPYQYKVKQLSNERTSRFSY